MRQALKPLDGIVQLEDTPKLEIAQQALTAVFTSILQQCNPRVLPPHHATVAHHRRGATTRQKIIATAFHRIVGSESGSLAQRERALRQARLPVNL